MDLRNYLSLLLRRWKEIIAFGVIIALLSGVYTTYYATTKYNSTLFFTVASSKYGISLYDDIRGADLFSESVQGWTKNPAMIDEIKERTGEDFGITGRVQETENVVVELSASSEEAITKVSEETLKVLEEKLKEFNLKTRHSFQLAVPTIQYETKVPGLGKNELIALVLGFLIGIAFAFVYEYLANKASTKEQVEEALGTEIAGEGEEMHKMLAKKLKSSVTLDLNQKLQSKDHEKLGKKDLILLITLGKTNLKDLKHVKVNSTSKLYPIIIK
ncbi:MAG: Wzz/FepE/Etk N-terminal domain-containing protein [Patescibacteria group bacterium]|nr:hypothetical protein [Patescibacteria group bacterium]